MSAGPIYLDGMSTTPLAPAAREAMLPWLGDRFGNASSTTHPYGWEASDEVERGRSALASLIGARPGSRLVFTSGATEANNTAILGIARDRAGAGAHLVSTAIEHPSVQAPLRVAVGLGASVTLVNPARDGIVRAADIEAALRPSTRLISVMAVNNEIGTAQPIAEIAEIARRRGIALHVDASQAIGKIGFKVEGIDFVSLSAHKLHGPIGIGALYIGPGAPTLSPLLHGGGQEQGLRAGTLAVAQIAGFGAACAQARREREGDSERIAALAERLVGRLRSAGGVRLNGSAERRIPGCLNLSVDGVLAEALIAATPGVAISSGSACSAGNGGGSHVLRALGLSPERRACSIRIGIGRYTRDDEIERAADLLLAGIARVRGAGRASPAAA